MAQPAIDWLKCYGGSGNEGVQDVIVASDGDYVFTGNSSSVNGDIPSGANLGDRDIWTVKINKANGAIIWQNNAGGEGSDVGNVVLEESDYIYSLGSSYSNTAPVPTVGGTDLALVVLDKTIGSFNTYYGFGGTDHDQINAARFAGSKPIVAGRSQSNDGFFPSNNGTADAFVINLTDGWKPILGGSDQDGFEGMDIDALGNIVACGYSHSGNGDITGAKGGSDGFVVKLDPAGSVLWKKNFGGTADEGCNAIVAVPDGGYVFVGYTQSALGDVGTPKGDADFWIVKLNTNGNIVWKNSFGGSGNDRAYAIAIDTDGGYVITGRTDSDDGDVMSGHKGGTDIWLIKVDVDGNLLWEQTFGGTGRDLARSVAVAADGSYILGGITGSSDGDFSGAGYHGGDDAFVIKTKATGTGIIDAGFQFTIKLYPNPANESISIDGITEGTGITLAHISGQELYTTKAQQPQESIRLSGYPGGVYLLRFRSPDGKEASLKFVKE